MDYKTKPTCRRDLRRYSQILRKVFVVPLSGPFPVLDALEKIRDVFGNCNYEIVEDNQFPPQKMAQCTRMTRAALPLKSKNLFMLVLMKIK